MGTIHLQGMLFKSHIGVYEFEQQYGNNFSVDVWIDSEAVNGETDDIAQTIDYSKVYEVVAGVMKQPGNLIEHAARKILDDLKEKGLAGTYCRVAVTKLHPPLGDTVNSVSVELEWNLNS